MEAQVALDNISSMSFLVHFLSSNLNVEVADKQKILETQNIVDRGTLLASVHAEGYSDAGDQA